MRRWTDDDPYPSPTGESAGRSRCLSNVVIAPTGKGGSRYGLGTLSSEKVNVGGLLPVKSADPTAEEVVEAFDNASPSALALIQQKLILGGFYPTLRPALRRPEP